MTTPKVHRPSGDGGGDLLLVESGGEIEVKSGGEIEVKSGGTVDIESGGYLKLAGTAISATATELNENDLSAVGAVSKVKVISMVAADFEDNSEVDTGWELPAKAIVTNVYLNVKTKENTATTKTVNVGTDGTGSNDPDGFLAGASVAAVGLVKGTLAYGAVTRGALLYKNTGDSSAPVPEPDVTSGGESVTVSAGDAGGFTEAVFDIIIEYIEVS